MSMKLVCPHCRATVEANGAGASVACPACRKLLPPRPATPAAPPQWEVPKLPSDGAARIKRTGSTAPPPAPASPRPASAPPPRALPRPQPAALSPSPTLAPAPAPPGPAPAPSFADAGPEGAGLTPGWWAMIAGCGLLFVALAGAGVFVATRGDKPAKAALAGKERPEDRPPDVALDTGKKPPKNKGEAPPPEKKDKGAKDKKKEPPPPRVVPEKKDEVKKEEPKKEEAPPPLRPGLDTFGNPNDPNGSLARDNEFKGKRLLAWGLESGDHKRMVFTADNPVWLTLKKKGFEVRFESGKFDPKWLKDTDQLWVFASPFSGMDEAGYAAVEEFVKGGKGLYLLADNDPYTAEAVVLARRLWGTTVNGNYLGTKIAVVRERKLTKAQVAKYTRSSRDFSTLGPYEVDDHPLLTGINFLYEGITISHVGPCDKLATAILASDKQILMAVSKVPGQRVVIDCGFTRYYYGTTDSMRFATKTAGTVRMAENVAAYLMGKTLR